MEALRRCYDPCCRDREISVVDMGLVERVAIDGDGELGIDLVLTSGWCPFVARLEDMVQDELSRLPGVARVRVRIVWEPAWGPERMSDSARAKLRLPLEQLEPLRQARLTQGRTSL
jgi:metal-sulfur cluster biosynthetic enzyme